MEADVLILSCLSAQGTNPADGPHPYHRLVEADLQVVGSLAMTPCVDARFGVQFFRLAGQLPPDGAFGKYDRYCG
jgi:hypothetical protein